MLEQMGSLWDIFLQKKSTGQPLVLGTLVKTTGSSYKKAGAMMLIEADLTTHGLLSGGCLEADLAEHAMAVFSDQKALSLDYDMSDESIFGLGAGCDGTLRVVLQLIEGDYLPFSALDPRPGQAQPTQLFINSDVNNGIPIGSFWLMQQQQIIESKIRIQHIDQHERHTLYYTPPPKVVVCGAGIDVAPLLEMMRILHWHVYLVDHRPGRLSAELHPKGTHLIKAETLLESSDSSKLIFDAAVIMTHNLDRDTAYLQHFYQTTTPWIGMLGPPQRRNKVLAKAGLDFDALSHRLHAPVGLDIGGHMPENIAVSIVAQLQQFFNSHENLWHHFSRWAIQ